MFRAESGTSQCSARQHGAESPLGEVGTAFHSTLAALVCTDALLGKAAPER